MTEASSGWRSQPQILPGALVEDAGERDEGGPHQRPGDVAGVLGRGPDLLPGVGAVAAEAPDDQDETDGGDEGVDAAIGIGADPLDQPAARAPEAGENVDPEHQDDAERKNEHAGFSAEAGRPFNIANPAESPQAQRRIASRGHRA